MLTTHSLTHLIGRTAALTLAGLVLLASPVAASVTAQHVSTQDLSGTTLTPVITERLRLGKGGDADQMLYRQPNPAGYPSTNLYNINTNAAGSVGFDLTVTHTAADSTVSGLDTYVFTASNGAASGGISLVKTSNTITQTFADGALDYNILHVFGITNANNGLATVSNVLFTSNDSDLAVNGSLGSGFDLASRQQADDWLALDTGLSFADYNWSFSAHVQLGLSGAGSIGSESIKFEFTGKQGAFTTAIPPDVVPTSAVPEPEWALLWMAGLLTVGLAKRRRSAV